MLKKLGISTAIIAGSMLINVYQAKAVVYEFNDFDPGNTGFSASGFFDISDNGDNIVDWSTELTDYDITFNNGFVFRSNSLETTTLEGVTIQGNALDFSAVTAGNLRFRSNTVPRTFEVFGDTQTARIADANDLLDSAGPLTDFSPTDPTAASVPFEFSPTLGLLAVGAIVGVSHLRKRMIASKLNDQDLA